MSSQKPQHSRKQEPLAGNSAHIQTTCALSHSSPFISISHIALNSEKTLPIIFLTLDSTYSYKLTAPGT